MMSIFSFLSTAITLLPLPAVPNSFEVRHSMFCNFTFVDQAAILLLGYLPQDIVGTSVFSYYEDDDLSILIDAYKSGELVIKGKSTGYIFKAICSSYTPLPLIVQQTQNICIHLYNVGPTSKTLVRRCTNVIQMFCVCWEGYKIR